MSIYDLIRTRIDIRDVFDRYGVEVRREHDGRGWALCPFHGEKTASLSFRDNRFHCFGCHEGGDATDFVAKLYGLSLAEAARKIASDFGMADYSAVSEVRRDPAVERARKLRENWKILQENIDSMLRRYTIKRETVDKWMPATETYLIAEWQSANENERVLLYKNYREVLEKIGNELKRTGGDRG